MTDEQMREQFEAWMRRNHPLDWFALECGGPLPAKYRLAVWAFAQKAYTAGAAAQRERSSRGKP